MLLYLYSPTALNSTGSGRLAKYIGRMHARPASILCELEFDWSVHAKVL